MTQSQDLLDLIPRYRRWQTSAAAEEQKADTRLAASEIQKDYIETNSGSHFGPQLGQALAAGTSLTLAQARLKTACQMLVSQPLLPASGPSPPAQQSIGEKLLLQREFLCWPMYLLL